MSQCQQQTNHLLLIHKVKDHFWPGSTRLTFLWLRRSSSRRSSSRMRYFSSRSLSLRSLAIWRLSQSWALSIWCSRWCFSISSWPRWWVFWSSCWSNIWLVVLVLFWMRFFSSICSSRNSLCMFWKCLLRSQQGSSSPIRKVSPELCWVSACDGLGLKQASFVLFISHSNNNAQLQNIFILLIPSISHINKPWLTAVDASSLNINRQGQSQLTNIIKMNKSTQQADSAHKWLEAGRSVWVQSMPQYPNPDEDAFLEAKVVDNNEKEVTVDLVDSMQRVKAPIQNVLKLTYGPNDVADMVDLEELNEPELLYNTKRRYLADQIFTYCGPTLVIINPYASIDKLFNDTTLQEYQGMVFTDNLEYKSLPPHVFALAAFCLWQLFDNERSQSIVISGESGAGKTENTKYCLKFLASLGRNMKELIGDNSNQSRNSFDSSQLSHTRSARKINYQNMRAAEKAIKKASNKVFGIEEKILGCNEVLEAFGNSKTIRNDNSSRFGKLILLVYGETQIDIRSAFIISYLLEKSRIVSVADGERNYHMFYYFVKGTSPEEKKKYLLMDPINKYYYLNQSSVYEIPKKSDEEEFKVIKKEFAQYLDEAETDCVFRILSIVLNIGNTNFKKGIEPKTNEQMALVVNEEYLKNVVELLEVDYAKFKHSFSFKTRKLGPNIIHSPLKYDQAIALRDSFAKNIYEKIFNYLVSKLNEKIEIEKIDFEGEKSRQNRRSIGLLDIFGFEVLMINSLEQFFINFANQKLQQLYVSYIFKEEQNEFLREGLKEFAHDIGFQDNKPIIDLFQLYPLGVFHLINESSELNKSDMDLPEIITKNHHKANVVTIPKSKRGHFQVNHSCSPVVYNTNGFTGKNKDQFPKQLLEVIADSKNQVLKTIIVGNEPPGAEQKKGNRASSKFLGSKFLSQMNKLTEELYSCDCHFVRCIKPNSKKAAKLFNSQAVLQSLRYLGVLDSIKIRKLGYIYRRPYKEFFKKFYEIERYIFSYPDTIAGKTEDDFKEQSRKIIEKFAYKELQEKDILFGAKKILVKESALNHLEVLAKDMRRLRIQSANRVKTMYLNAKFREKVKGFFCRKNLLKTFMFSVVTDVRSNIFTKKVKKIQNVVKKYLWAVRYEKNKEVMNLAAMKIINYLRMRKLRSAFLTVKQNVRKVQSNIRTFLLVKRVYKQKLCRSLISTYLNDAWNIIINKKALLIQRSYKGYKVRKLFQQVIRRMKFRAFVKRANQKFAVNSIRELLWMYKTPVVKLQRIVKARYIRRSFLLARKSALIIQKAYRRHLHKRFYLERLWRKYKLNLYECQSQKTMELSRLGINMSQKEARVPNFQQTVGASLKLYPHELSAKYGENGLKAARDIRINQTISFTDKNTMQLYLLDVDIISTICYRGMWTHKYADTKAEMARKGQYPLQINVGEKYTSVLSSRDKIYTFGGQEEEQKQQAVSKIEVKGCPAVICVNEESGYLLNKEYQLFEWGDNKNSELFSVNEKPFKIFSPSKGKFSNIVDIEVKGDKKFLADYDGKVFTKVDEAIELLSFGPKVQVSQIVSSYGFTHFLTTSGYLYSFGENSDGELGIGKTSRPILQPVINEFFMGKKEMIETVSVGLTHSIARSKLGYVYMWGGNKFGQTSFEPVQCVSAPILMEMDKQKVKAIQAVAGLRSSYILLDNYHVVGIGTSTGFSRSGSNSFTSIDLLHATNMSSKNLVPLKISTTWTRHMSLLTVNCLQINKCKPGTKPDIIYKYCKMMAKEWSEKMVYPPYSEWMDNILNLSDMRKFKFQKSVKPKSSAATGKIAENDMEEIKLLMDLRKTSTLFKNAARKKIEEITTRLAAKPQGQWSKEDQQLNLYIMEQCLKVLK